VAADFPFIAQRELEYGLLAVSLRHAGLPLSDAWPSLQASRGGTRHALAPECDRIDYIFSSTRQGACLALEPIAARVEPFLDPNVKEGSLSDHAGVECEFTLRR
jgi:endonuclease/exonuclease/phosphatase family metal-dependent hydrolase